MNRIMDNQIICLHCVDGRSNKVYNIEMKQDVHTLKWLIYVEWGSFNGKLRSEIKIWGLEYLTAVIQYNKLLRSKLQKGYNNITTTGDVNNFYNNVTSNILKTLRTDERITIDEFTKLKGLLESSDKESNLLARNILTVHLNRKKEAA